MMPKEEVLAMLAHKLGIIDKYTEYAVKNNEEQTMLWSEEDLNFYWCQYWFHNSGWFKARIMKHLSTKKFKEINNGIILLP